MKDSKVYKYYSELPQWAKGAVVLGVGVVLFMVGKKLVKVVFPSEEDRRQKQLESDINNDINRYTNQGIKPTYNDSQYSLFANTIHNGMRYCVGDDYGTVEVTMKKMINDLDVAKLIKAFGKRPDYCFGIPTGEFDLITYVQKELGNDYGGITNYRVRNINEDWARKGIKYKL